MVDVKWISIDSIDVVEFVDVMCKIEGWETLYYAKDLTRIDFCDAVRNIQLKPRRSVS